MHYCSYCHNKILDIHHKCENPGYKIDSKIVSK